MTDRREVAIVGSGFAGSLLARLLAVRGHDVVLLERGTHPRFAIGESTTPLANLSLERIARQYGLRDCWELAAHGRWTAAHPELQRGLKRGFTYYRHHPGEPFANRGLESERLLVAASPDDAVADTHWLRSDVDARFVREAIAEGVDYRDRCELTGVAFSADGAVLHGERDGDAFALGAGFVVDASGPGGFLARALGIPSGLARMETRSSLLYAHFAGVAPIETIVPGLPNGPYPDEQAAVHHLIDEGWMYSLRFDDGVTSAGFLLGDDGLASLGVGATVDAAGLWARLLARYPTLERAFARARPLMPIAFRRHIQHRLTQATGARWAMLPHAYAFVDPLYSTGIAWALRGVERLALAFEEGGGLPTGETLARYDRLLATEADQIDRLVAGAYEAMADFDSFAAHAMLYFACVSFAEISQRLRDDQRAAWQGFLGVGDAVLEPLFGEALRRLRSRDAGFAEWVARAIEPRNVAGLADPARRNLYPVELETVLDGCAKLGMTRDEIVAATDRLRGRGPAPSFLREVRATATA